MLALINYKNHKTRIIHISENDIISLLRDKNISYINYSDDDTEFTYRPQGFKEIPKKSLFRRLKGVLSCFM